MSLMYPHNTEMDLSIALALYFAARGVGLRHEHGISSPTVSTTLARVLLSGLGADELFGGYSRHGVAFSRGGYAGLAQELKLDVARLGKRNLGRDDRVMAHWGREVRFPFLDEDLMRWAIGLPVWEKCDFGNSEQGEQTVEPGKRVLRLLAAALGMEQVAGEKKRAVSTVFVGYTKLRREPSADLVAIDPVWIENGQDGGLAREGHDANSVKDSKHDGGSTEGPSDDDTQILPSRGTREMRRSALCVSVSSTQVTRGRLTDPAL